MFFGSSCSSGLLSVAYYALQSVLQLLFHTFTWMKMPKLIFVQLFNKQRLEPLRQKEKKCQYTRQHCVSLTKKKGNWQLTETPVCPCTWISRIQSSIWKEPKGQTCCCCWNRAGCWQLTEVCEFRQPHHSTVHKTLSWCPWQCLPHQATALMWVTAKQLWCFRLWIVTPSCSPVNWWVC